MKKTLLALALTCSFASFAAPIPAPTNYALDAPIYSGVKLNLDFKDAPIRVVLHAISQHLSKGIVLSEGVQGTVTLNLTEVTAEEAFDLVLLQKGLSKVDQGSSYLVTSFQDSSFSEALVSSTYRLKYTKVSDLQAFFSNNLNILSPKGSILYDARSNSVVVSDVAGVVSKVLKVIESLDIPLDQVEIEARIVQVTTTYGKDLGIKYGTTFESPKSQVITALNGSLSDFASLGFTFLSGSFNLDLTLDALEKEGLAKVISTPKIMTLDNSEATISTGSQIPYQTSTVTNSGTSTNTLFKDALLSLSVTPSISPDGKVLMRLSITNDALQGYAQNGEAILSKNELKTQVSVSDGETIVLGGVYIDSDSGFSSGVPYLSKIKLLKPLFSNKTTSKEKKELLIFIMPKVKKSYL